VGDRSSVTPIVRHALSATIPWSPKLGAVDRRRPDEKAVVFIRAVQLDG
jgi:hypothetical protein